MQMKTDRRQCSHKSSQLLWMGFRKKSASASVVGWTTVDSASLIGFYLRAESLQFRKILRGVNLSKMFSALNFGFFLLSPPSILPPKGLSVFIQCRYSVAGGDRGGGGVVKPLSTLFKGYTVAFEQYSVPLQRYSITLKTLCCIE